MKKYSYHNRDISWLSFNYRVFEEALDKSLPLYERLKFLAIYSNNLEEFYRVRVSYYRSLLRQLPPTHKKIKEINPQNILLQINETVGQYQDQYNYHFINEIIPELKREGITLIGKDEEITSKQEELIRNIFKYEILPSVQPVLLVKKRVKPFLKTGHVYLTLQMRAKNRTIRGVKSGRRFIYGLIKLPTDHGVSRFIELPEEDNKHYIMFLEDVIMRNVNVIFPGYAIESWHSVKVTRDADLEYEDYDGSDLIEIIENIETTRAVGEPNRLLFDNSMSKQLLKFVVDTFDITPEIMVRGGKFHNFRDFFSFPNPLSPELEHEKLVQLKVPELEKSNIFESLDDKEYLLHFPYQTFDYVIKFLNQAAQDDDVTEISLTQYRAASNSAIVNALINAALNGKKVTVFVELKARFDEENNLQNAREMRKAGISILYSIPGLKVHAKLAMVTRKVGDKYKQYAFLGTGNFNEKTARLYCDHGLFTTNPLITREVACLFNYLQDQEHLCNFQHLLIPSFNLVATFKRLIDNEIEQAKNGKTAYICLKMNGLEDPVMIDKLYEASEAGVKIDLIIRGVCCLKTNQPFSKNIKVIRIVDRFLEHARIFLFYNGGEEIVYMGSADWMKRNLYRRIECIFPIYDKDYKQEIIDILNIQLSDNTKARIINENLENVPINSGELSIRTQTDIYKYLSEKNK